MAQRLPKPGGDIDTWGDVLNGFLEVAHNPDGTLIPAAVSAAGGGGYSKPGGGIPESDLDTSTQTIIDSVASKYVKPGGGIPNTDLSSGVQASLAAANSAVQSVNSKTPASGNVVINMADINDVQGGSGATNNQVLAYNSGSSKWVPATVSSTSVSDATTSSKGIIQLAGDLSGTAASPTVTTIGGATPVTQSTVLSGDLSGSLPGATVAKLKGVSLPASAPSTNQVLTALTSSTTTWTTPAAGVTLDSTVGDIQADTTNGTAVVGNTGKAADAGHQHPLVVHDHTSSNKGGAIPVAGLSATGAASSSTYLRGDGSWSTPAAGVALDSTASDIQPLGSQAAGSIGKAADAGHVHAMPRLDQVSAPTAAVALNSQKITSLANGTVSSDAAAFGQIPTAGTGSSNYAAGNDSRITGALQSSNNLSDTANAGTARLNLQTPVLASCQAVATANVSTLTGLPASPVTDGYTTVDGDRILLTAQTTTSQNGPWVVHTGSWLRPADFASASVTTGRSLQINGGTTYTGTEWVLATTSSVTVDTTAQSWKLLAIQTSQLPNTVALTSNLPMINLATVVSPGDGSADVSSQLNALFGTVGHYFVPKGTTFRVDNVVTITANGLVLEGSGTFTAGPLLTSHMLKVTAKDVTVAGLTFDGAANLYQTTLTVAPTAGTYSSGAPLVLSVASAAEFSGLVGQSMKIGDDEGSGDNVTIQAVNTGANTISVSGTVSAGHIVGQTLNVQLSNGISADGHRLHFRNLTVKNIGNHAMVVGGGSGGSVPNTTMSSGSAKGAISLSVASGTGFTTDAPVLIHAGSTLAADATHAPGGTYPVGTTTLTLTNAGSLAALPDTIEPYLTEVQLGFTANGSNSDEETVVITNISGNIATITPTLNTHAVGENIVTTEPVEENTLTAGASSTVTLAQPALYAHSSGDWLVQPVASEITIENCNFHNIYYECIYNFFTNTSIDGPWKMIISGSTFSQCGNAAINGGGRHIIISGNSISNVGYRGGGEGITFYGGNTFNRDWIITGNTIEWSGDNGIHGAGRQLAITGNTIKHVTGNGIIIDPVYGSISDQDVSITGNTIHDIQGPAICITLYNSVTITGNNCTRTDYGSIRLIGSASNPIDTFTISGNVIQDAGQAAASPPHSGVVCMFVQRGSISGNTITDCPQGGIYISDDATHPSKKVTVASNTIDNCGPFAVQAAGGATNILVSANNISNCSSNPIQNNGGSEGLVSSDNHTDQSNAITAVNNGDTTYVIGFPHGLDFFVLGAIPTQGAPVRFIDYTHGYSYVGRRVTVYFNDSHGTLVQDNNPNIGLLHGSQDAANANNFTFPQGSTLTLQYYGSNEWVEVSRSVIPVPSGANAGQSLFSTDSSGTLAWDSDLNSLIIVNAVPTYLTTSSSTTTNKPGKIETIPRLQIGTGTLTLSSGTPIGAIIPVRKGQTFSGIGFYASALEGTPANRTHLWGALVDSGGTVQAVTGDYTSNTNTPLTSTAINGLWFGSTYTATASGYMWLYLCEVMSSTACITIAAAARATGLQAVSPVLAGTGTASQTTPPSVSTTGWTLTTATAFLYYLVAL